MDALPWAQTQHLSFSETELPPGWSPTMQQDPRYCKEKEKVGCPRGWDSLAGEGRKEAFGPAPREAGSLGSGVTSSPLSRQVWAQVLLSTCLMNAWKRKGVWIWP